MKKNIQIWLLAALLLTGGLAGCYNDKGNYDYKEINEVECSIKAAIKGGNEIVINEMGSSRCKQSPIDVVVVYTPVISQTMAQNEENLVYEWKVTKAGEKAVFTTDKVLELEFPANTATSYSIVFSVTDELTNVSFYKSLSINTSQPYINSWFVLNEKEGVQQLSVIEEPDSVNSIISFDGYGDLGLSKSEDIKVIRDATHLIYSPTLDRKNAVNPEILQLMSKNGVWRTKPSTLSMTAMKLPSVVEANKLSLVNGIDGSVACLSTVIVDERGQMHYCYDGETYEMIEPYKTPYRTGVLGHNLGEPGQIAIWDNEEMAFGYADIRGGKAELNFIYQYVEGLNDTEIVWMGPEYGDGDESKNSLGIAIARHKATQDYIVYHLGRNDDKEYAVTRSDAIGQLMGGNAVSQFATAPYAFLQQFFYISGSKLYRCNVSNGESVEIYDAEGTISKMKFRILNENIGRPHEMRMLGMAVEKEDGTWELHQIELTIAGDLKEDSVKKFAGFGAIKDFCFSFRNTASN
ncbi:PKD-like family lipoprotein [Bacteroides acidifaciens]|uniref:PKD-like family lipoprotein n=1 Tax=Bacteroides acidifaciens TaxID=85831 RepID=UPI0023CEE3E6|nr:PKD-like family lipoprotein [Bacteroides acidifaciens]MDE6819959.1 hypothetical protein [Bacteroides acidifaciens]